MNWEMCTVSAGLLVGKIMKLSFRFGLIVLVEFVGILFTAGCGKNVNSKLIPSVPRWIPQSIDTSFVETGIGSVPDGDWIHLVWYPNPETDIARYIISRNDGTGFVDYSSTTDTTYTDKAVSISVSYSYQVRAVNSDGNESDGSTIIHYELLEKSQLQQPVGQAPTFRNPRFMWQFYQSTAPPVGWIFRLQKLGNPAQQILATRQITVDQLKDFTYQDLKGLALRPSLPDSLTAGQYRWRADAFDDNFTGSKSAWGEFVVQ